MRPPVSLLAVAVLFLSLLLVPFGAGPAPADAQQAWTVRRLTTDLNIPADPNIDVAAEINAAILAAAPRTLFLLEGLYRIDHTVNIEGKTYLAIERAPGLSPQATGFVRYVQTLRPMGGPRPYYAYIAVRDSTYVTLRGFTIKGPLAQPQYIRDYEHATGLSLAAGAAFLTISDLDITGVHGDAIHMNGAADVSITRVHGWILGRHAMAPVGGERIVIANSLFERTARGGIDIETLQHSVRDLTIQDTQVLDYRNIGFGAHAYAPAAGAVVERVALLRTVFRGGLSFSRLAPPPGVQYRDISYTDVSYDYKTAFPPGGSLGAMSVREGAVGVRLVRLRAVFHISQTYRFDGEGTISDSVFISESSHPPVPVVCYGLGWIEKNSTGTAPCPGP